MLPDNSRRLVDGIPGHGMYAVNRKRIWLRKNGLINPRECVGCHRKCINRRADVRHKEPLARSKVSHGNIPDPAAHSQSCGNLPP